VKVTTTINVQCYINLHWKPDHSLSSYYSDYYDVAPFYTGVIIGPDWAANYVNGTLHCDLAPTEISSDGGGRYWLLGQRLGEAEFWKRTWELNKDDPEKAKIIMANMLGSK
jgi:hypothetical protein